MKKYIPIYFLLISNLLFSQIYTLQNNETLKNAHILNDTNYAIVVEKNNANNKTYDILYKNSRLEGYKDSGIIKVLPNGTLVATMLKPSIGKDMWVVIYGNKEQEFDSIEASAFAGNNSIIFARLMDYGVAVINGEATTQYSELYEYVINNNNYAFSYSIDGEYFVNINGEEKAVSGKAEKMKYANDGKTLIYVINSEGSAVIYNGNNDTESFISVDDLASYNLQNQAFAVKLMPQIDTNLTTNDNMMSTNINTNDTILTNISTVTNYNLSNISVYTNEEGITVKGQSNTIALMMVTNVITNIAENILDFGESNNNIITNEFINTSILINNRNIGEFNLITNMSFSPDGQSLIFINIDTNNMMQLYVRGNMIGSYDNIYTYQYSKDSKNFAYGVSSNNISFIILNNKKINEEYNKINNIYFSDNNELVYNASKNYRQYIISDNFESPSYNTVTSFKFYGDSFAFTAERLGRKYYFIWNKETATRKELGGYDYISEIDAYSSEAISIASDGKNVFIIKNGFIY